MADISLERFKWPSETYFEMEMKLERVGPAPVKNIIKQGEIPKPYKLFIDVTFNRGRSHWYYHLHYHPDVYYEAAQNVEVIILENHPKLSLLYAQLETPSFELQKVTSIDFMAPK